MLLSIWSINLLFMHNFRLKKLQFKQLVDSITINFLSSENFASMKDIRRKCNPIVSLSKVKSNKKILSEVVTKLYPMYVKNIN